MILLYRQIMHYDLAKCFAEEFIVIMKTDENIRYEKLQYDINKDATKITLSLGKIDKNEYVTGEEILPSGPSQIIQ